MRLPDRPAPRWLEVAAIVLLLLSAMIEPRVTVLIALALLTVGLAVVARADSPQDPRRRFR